MYQTIKKNQQNYYFLIVSLKFWHNHWNRAQNLSVPMLYTSLVSSRYSIIAKWRGQHQIVLTSWRLPKIREQFFCMYNNISERNSENKKVFLSRNDVTVLILELLVFIQTKLMTELNWRPTVFIIDFRVVVKRFS